VGRELVTRVIIDGVPRDRVRVHLDSRALEIGGRPRVAVPLSGVQALDVRGSELRLATPDGIFEIELGDQAAAWAAKIRSPPSRAEKLGLAPGQRVVLIGLDDAALKAEVSAAGARRVELDSGVDLVFLGAEAGDDLASLPRVVPQLAPAGALWVVRRKGRGATLAEGDVRAAARAAGLVDVKVVAFSETHSADKFVLPVAARVGRGPVPARKTAAPDAGDRRAGEKRAGARAPAETARRAPTKRAARPSATAKRAPAKAAGAKKRAPAKTSPAAKRAPHRSVAKKPKSRR
jgi:hypothetical protein